jgi:hypothetical protein
MERHESKYIELHNELIEIDLNLVNLITKINKTKLLTRGCCQNYENNRAYIIFEYNCFIELLQNQYILKFIDDTCTKSEIYYANNNLRHIKYNEAEYNENLKNITEIWICITFPNILINDFINIIEKIY